MEKLCIFCKHWRIDPGERGYSEVTLGSPARMSCEKDVYDLNLYDFMSISNEVGFSEDQFRKQILMAETCGKYSPDTPRSKNLRESAKDVPHCFGCLIENPNGDLLCLAHSNALQDGRGASHKSKDIYGAIVCQKCHDMIDGRSGGLSKQAKREMHSRCWQATMRWWIEEGYVKEN